MKFVIKGAIADKENSSFKVELEAKSEKHARELAFAAIGSRQGINKSKIKISSVERK